MSILSFPSLFISFLIISCRFSHAKVLSNLSSPYHSPSTFLSNYNLMLKTLKIFVCDLPSPNLSSNPVESLFHQSLLKSRFLTPDPNLAHLFYLPLPSDPSIRSISRSIRDLRFSSPLWNQTLGADHFYVSCSGIGIESDRNIVELKTNSIQISCFPTVEGRFIPHKDVTLPPISKVFDRQPNKDEKLKFLGFFYRKEEDEEISTVLGELQRDPEFLIESQPLDEREMVQRLSSSRFCLFFYGFGKGLAIGEALRFGCVPVVISDRPILDLPFADVLKWTEIAVLVRMRGGGKQVKRVLESTCGKRYEKMRELGRMASVHFSFSSDGYGYDAFHTVMYQLWNRRHLIRYGRREWI